MSVRVAVLADTSLQRHLLQHALAAQGYQVVINSDPSQLDSEQLQDTQPDIWLVNLLHELEDNEELLHSLFEGDVPVLFGEGQAPERTSEDYPRWQRSLYHKLEKMLPSKAQPEKVYGKLVEPDSSGRLNIPEPLIKHLPAQNQPASEVWLLAASLGGPSAVKEFLDALPGGLPIGFIYAQHIDPRFETKLPQVVGRHSAWPVRLARHEEPVLAGEVVVVPIEKELSFSDSGRMQISPQGWNGLYSPCINKVIFNLTHKFAKRSGVIVFSGMGEDGSHASLYANKQGVPIWAQTSETCACPSMPDSVRDTGLVTLSATPRGLAMGMLNYLLQRYAA